jgi:hypothetical protein
MAVERRDWAWVCGALTSRDAWSAAALPVADTLLLQGGAATRWLHVSPDGLVCWRATAAGELLSAFAALADGPSAAEDTVAAIPPAVAAAAALHFHSGLPRLIDGPTLAVQAAVGFIGAVAAQPVLNGARVDGHVANLRVELLRSGGGAGADVEEDTLRCYRIETQDVGAGASAVAPLPDALRRRAEAVALQLRNTVELHAVVARTHEHVRTLVVDFYAPDETEVAAAAGGGA